MVFGTFFSDAVTLLKEGADLEDIPFLFELLFYDNEYVTATVGNIVLGLIFAGLGVFGLLRATGKELSDTKVIDLE